MRKNIVAGNWKMNNDLPETKLFLTELKKQQFPKGVDVIIAPSYTNLYYASQSLQDYSVVVASQNMHQQDSGAFTGAVSAKMLKSVGVETVILGHSERRAIFREDNAILSAKVNAAVANEIAVIFCVGEELEERKQETHFDLVYNQLSEALFDLSADSWKNIVIAYEPVWAIGTGETASPEQAQEMHRFIREKIAEKYSKNVADKVSILYGGSVKPNNAKEIFKQEDVDGGLIGGASLKVDSFMDIIHSF